MEFIATLLKSRRFIARIVVLAVAVGAAYGFVATGERLAGAQRGAATGLFISVLLTLFETLWEIRLRASVSFGLGLLLRSTAWLVIIALGMNLTVLVFRGFDHVPLLPGADFRQDMVFAVLAVFAFNFVVSVNALLGGRVLVSFLLGRYHRPIEEERVFMFLDIAGSTAVAGKIGDIGFHRFVNQVFADATGPILESRGEIYKYLGDGIIVTWPLSLGLERAACLVCYLDIVDALQARRAFYEREFGVAANLRAGLHAGSVVTGEMGRAKQEIVFLGDTVNTASRLEAACAERDERVLLSGDLMALLAVPENVSVRKLGPERLRGREAPIELFTACRAAPAG